MPFKSEAQRRYLYAKHPAIARRWSAEEKAVSKNEARYGPGGGGHGSRIIEKRELTEAQRSRRKRAWVGAGVGAAGAHTATMAGGGAALGYGYSSRALPNAGKATHLKNAAKIGGMTAVGGWHPKVLARSLTSPYAIVPATGAIVGAAVGARKRQVKKADWKGIEEHKRRAAGSRRTRNRAGMVAATSLGTGALLADALPGSVHELRDISRTARGRVVPGKFDEEPHEFRVKNGHMGMSPGMRARNVVRSAKVRPGGAAVGGALGVAGLAAGVSGGAALNAKRHDRAIASQRKANAKRAAAKATVVKSRRQYDPEHRRQRRLGAAEAVLVAGGAGAGGYGGHGAYQTARQMRSITGVTGKDAKAVTATRDALKHGVLIRRRHLGALAGGAALLGSAGALRGHAEKPKGMPWD